MYLRKEKSKVNWVIAGLLLGIIVAAMDNTIISTAMGTIISEIGGMDKFIWVSSAYLIASVVGMPIYGKLSDMYGRKLFYMVGLGLFVLGSVLCGLSQSMGQLIIFRAVQGLGGGAIMPIAFTIIFDIVPVTQRGKISGLFGAAFGVSSVFGPLIGAFFAEYINWRGIFYVNIPLGLVSLIFIFCFYHESLNHFKQKIDWVGAILLVSSVLSLMFALEMGGKNFKWSSFQIIGLFSLFTILFIVFLFVEKKVSEPIIPLDLFKSRLFAASQGVSLFYGSVFIIATVYIPIFVQGAFGESVTNSGLILIPMMIGTVVGSQIGGLLVAKLTYRNIMLGSISLLFTGFILLSTLSNSTSRWLVTLYMIITGISVGISFSVLSMSSMHSINFNRRGSANSSVTFFRAIGMTLGITIFGTIQNNIMQVRFLKNIPEISNLGRTIESRSLLQQEVRMHIPADVLDKMTNILAGSIAEIFKLSLIPLTIALFFIIIMGNGRLENLSHTIKNEKEVVSPDVNETGDTRYINGGE